MTNTPAFNKLHLESAKNTIVDNLKISHQSKLVNIMCATRGLDDNPMKYDALDELIATGTVKIKLYPVTGKFGAEYDITMYQYNIFS